VKSLHYSSGGLTLKQNSKRKREKEEKSLVKINATNQNDAIFSLSRSLPSFLYFYTLAKGVN